MRIIARRTLKEFWERHRHAEAPLKAWYKVAALARWSNPADVKASFNSADIRPGERAIFDIGGNKYRIVAVIRYRFGIVYIRFVGTHKEYDNVDVDTV